MTYLLYNELANAGNGRDDALAIVSALSSKGVDIGEESLVSLVGLDPKEFFAGLGEEDSVIIYGGDGTLNHFVNNLGDQPVLGPLYYCPEERGGDFQRDLPEDVFDSETGLYRINRFIENLPFVEVKGKKYCFLTGVGFGIDGECCVKAEEMRAAGEKDINYGSIGLKLLMGPFDPPKATVRLDEGEPFELPKVYMASAMLGRYYGRGVAIAPKQDRRSGLLTFVCIHGKSKLATLFLFPKLMKGTHVKDRKACYLAYAKTIEVEFDRPCGLQIDGEVLIGVTHYKAYIGG